jgi:hypothetical protein
MRAMPRKVATAVFALSIGACAVGDPSPDQNATDISAISAGTTSSDTPQRIEVPDELSIQQLPDGFTIDGNTVVTPNACSLKLVFCRDPDHGSLPSICSNGCTSQQKIGFAQQLCRSVCGPNAFCGAFVDLGGC